MRSEIINNELHLIFDNETEIKNIIQLSMFFMDMISIHLKKSSNNKTVVKELADELDIINNLLICLHRYYAI